MQNKTLKGKFNFIDHLSAKNFFEFVRNQKRRDAVKVLDNTKIEISRSAKFFSKKSKFFEKRFDLAFVRYTKNQLKFQHQMEMQIELHRKKFEKAQQKAWKKFLMLETKLHFEDIKAEKLEKSRVSNAQNKKKKKKPIIFIMHSLQQIQDLLQL